LYEVYEITGAERQATKPNHAILTRQLTNQKQHESQAASLEQQMKEYQQTPEYRVSPRDKLVV